MPRQLHAPKPVIILLTDSGDWNQATTLRNLQQTMSRLPNPPVLHVIGYGRNVDRRFLESLAQAGNGTCVVCGTNPNATADVGRLELVGAFEQVADRPDKRAALMSRGAQG